MERVKNYIDGKWVESTSGRLLEIRNPATGDLIGQVPMSTREELDQCVAAAGKAYDSWRRTPAVTRCRYLFRFKELVERQINEIAGIITLEHGKEFRAAVGEVRRLAEMVEVASGVTTTMMGDYTQDVAPSIDEYTIRVPLGVFAVIPPFNFPGMVPYWFMPWAIAAGNTYIVKNNEQCPLTQHYLFSLLDQAGFPPGVVNLINGDRECAEWIMDHPEIKGVSFVGSSAVARVIYERCGRNGKRVQAQGGANNFILVMPDADLKGIMPNLMESCFGNSGQRCLAGSVILALGDDYERVRDAVVDAASRLKVGNGLDESVDMGPVISRKALDKLHADVDRAIAEGARLLLDGRGINVEGCPEGYFMGPTILEAEPGMYIFDEEIFGPVVCLKRVESFDQAVRLINSSRYGNASSIYTRNGHWAREFRFDVVAGNIGINVGVPAAMAFYPFGGMKESFFGALHGQGKDAVAFFTDQKLVIERWMMEKGLRERWF